MICFYGWLWLYFDACFNDLSPVPILRFIFLCFILIAREPKIAAEACLVKFSGASANMYEIVYSMRGGWPVLRPKFIMYFVFPSKKTLWFFTEAYINGCFTKYTRFPFFFFSFCESHPQQCRTNETEPGGGVASGASTGLTLSSIPGPGLHSLHVSNPSSEIPESARIKKYPTKRRSFRYVPAHSRGQSKSPPQMDWK